jgi:sporulation protein YlmC with PRC-barrel domain
MDMFQSLRQMTGYTVRSKDGQQIGTVSDFLFDDMRWVIRYMAVDTNSDMGGKRVLLSPVVISKLDQDRRSISIQVESDQIAASPATGSSDPVTRQHEVQIHEFYRWPAYWEEAAEVPPVEAGMSGWPVTEMMTEVEAQRKEQGKGKQNPSIRSLEGTFGFTVQSRDGEDAGTLHDLIVHEQNWRISYMIVSTDGILPGRKVVLSPASVVEFDWENEVLVLGLSRETIRNGQEYHQDISIERSSDDELYQNPDPKRNR